MIPYIVEIEAGALFSQGLKDHLNKVFLQNSVAQEPQDLREFVLIEAASYWHRPGFAMQDVVDRAISVIFAREAQKTSFSPAEELQYSIAHEALYYLRCQVDETTPPLFSQD